MENNHIFSYKMSLFYENFSQIYPVIYKDLAGQEFVIDRQMCRLRENAFTVNWSRNTENYLYIWIWIVSEYFSRSKKIL